jgi:membrane protease YdiL (CAAX protease family)
MTNKILNNPLLKSISLMLGLILVLFIAGMLTAIRDIDSNIIFFVAFLIVSVLIIVHIIKNKKYKTYGFKKSSFKEVNILYILPLFIISLIPLLAGVNPELTLSRFFYLIFYMALVAFVEEVLYRAIIFNNLKQKSIKYAVIISAIMFGISHLITMTAGKGLIDVLNQVILAIIIGLILALIINYSKNIYICIGYHFLNNLIVSISDSFGIYDLYITYVLLSALILYLLFLIQKLKNLNTQSRLV